MPAGRSAATASLLCAALFCVTPSAPLRAGEALVAVAANFAEVAERLEPAFEAATGHELTVTAGSTGKLYAQITSGAPFDVLLAADRRRPRLLEEDGFAMPGTRFTYAVGRLALWSADPERIGEDGAAAVAAESYSHLAIANPELAPYGAAARQALDSLGLWDTVEGRIVMGQNIGQTFSMVSTGNAELGLVALSHARSPRNGTPGSLWVVPAHHYEPIRQDAVLLARARDNAAARAFLDYLRSGAARAVIAEFGYGTG